MRGLLKDKSPGSQLLLLVSITLASFFILGMIGTVLLSSMSGFKLAEVADPGKWDFTKPGFLDFLRGMQVIQFIALFLIPSFIGARLFSEQPGKYLGLKKPSNIAYFLAGTAVLLAAIPLVGWLGELNQRINIPGEIGVWMRKKENDIMLQQKALLSKHTITDLILNIICVAGLAGIGEELLFRGMVQRLLIKIFKSPMAGIIIAAFLFSAFHFQFFGFFPRFFLGIILGLIYWYSGSLWVAMLAHFIYDAVLVTLLYINPSMANEESPVPAANVAMAAALSFALVALIMAWMKKNSKANYQQVYGDDPVPKEHPF